MTLEEEKFGFIEGKPYKKKILNPLEQNFRCGMEFTGEGPRKKEFESRKISRSVKNKHPGSRMKNLGEKSQIQEEEPGKKKDHGSMEKNLGERSILDP